jgi:hypothetical protein
MKKLIIIAALFVVTNLKAQKDSTRKDTLVHTVLPLEVYKQLLFTLDKVIDSKKLSQEIFDLFQKNTTVYDKPKEIIKK